MTAAPYWASDDGDVQLHLGDCLDVLRTLPADSVDAIVTDPPAGVAFMSRTWDTYGSRARFVEWLTERLSEALRVLKPGGHALVWSLPRTSHWTAWAVEDAGFEVRDCVLHVFGSGFPKSRNVSAGIDRAAGAEREVVGASPDSYDRSASSWQAENGRPHGMVGRAEGPRLITAPATEDAARWDGWGTALKPGQEMWWLARKPLGAGTVAANVLRWGTGALNIAACKVGSADKLVRPPIRRDDNEVYGKGLGVGAQEEPAGRWPANLVFTHSAACVPAGTRRVRNRSGSIPAPPGEGQAVGVDVDFRMRRTGWQAYGDADGLETVEAWVCAADCPVGELDRQSGVRTSGGSEHDQSTRSTGIYGTRTGNRNSSRPPDSGGASRFYPVFRYQAKAPASERPRLEDGTAHETVKPLNLVRWMVRLVTPPGGTVLDMFAGSGPVAEACIIEGFRAVLIEQDPRSAELIRKRLSKPIQPVMFGLDAS